jgi:hypothetical protein
MEAVEQRCGRKGRGYAGKQSMGFWFWEQGYFIVEGLSDSMGLNTSVKGLDGVDLLITRKSADYL